MNGKSYDIIVVGGGFAGTAAAICAARRGRKVLLIEKYNCLGGAPAYGLVNPFMPYWTTSEDGKERIDLSRGLFREILQRLEQAGGLHKEDKCCFNEEVLKCVLLHMLEESGASVLFQAHVTGAEKENDRLTAVRVSGVSGDHLFSADYFIDATGDANLVFLAGFPYELGRKEDGFCQPMTLCFRLGNVQFQKNPYVFAEVQKLYKKYRAEGRIKNPREDVLLFHTVSKDVLHFNTTRVIRLDPTNVFDVTRAEIEAREQVFELYEFLRENFEEFKDCVLLSTAMQIGVRESRRIVGLHMLTEEEIVACTRFEDSVAVCNYDIDIHDPDGSGTSHYFFPAGKYYTIPYRCLIPQGAHNLLAAGRCVSATHEAQASLRIMPTCCNLGEAAGIAAAIAAESKKAVNEINVKALQDALVQSGAKIF